MLAGDYNVVPTELDIYPTRSWDKDALVQPKSRAAFARWSRRAGRDAIRTLHPAKPMFTFWDYKRNRWPRDAGLRLDHLLAEPGADAAPDQGRRRPQGARRRRRIRPCTGLDRVSTAVARGDPSRRIAGATLLKDEGRRMPI